MAIRHEKVKIITGTAHFSGSIEKIQNVGSAVIEEITFGSFKRGGTDLVDDRLYTSGTDITMTTTNIEGPITFVRLASGTALVYYTN